MALILHVSCTERSNKSYNLLYADKQIDKARIRYMTVQALPVDTSKADNLPLIHDEYNFRPRFQYLTCILSVCVCVLDFRSPLYFRCYRTSDVLEGDIRMDAETQNIRNLVNQHG